MLFPPNVSFAAQLEMADLDFSSDDEDDEQGDAGVGNDSWSGGPPGTAFMDKPIRGGRPSRRSRGGRSFRNYRGGKYSRPSFSTPSQGVKRGRASKRAARINPGVDMTNVRTSNCLPGVRLMAVPGRRAWD